LTAARPVVVDTMAVSALLNEQRDPDTARDYRRLVGDRPVLVSFVTIAEMRYGALKAGWGELRTRGLERSLSQVVVVQPDDELIRACASLRAECERGGHPLGQKVHEADRWIAASALRLGLEVVSDDTVFDQVDRLSVLRPRTA
jgi:tRNA(fMet)-specific endonuclease VapC